MKNLKFRAFTLMELTIAMLISAISIGMAFYMFQYFDHLRQVLLVCEYVKDQHLPVVLV